MVDFAARSSRACPALLLVLACAPALAQPDPDAGAAQPRFAVEAMRLTATPGSSSVDARYDLDSRLAAMPDGAQHGSGFELRATLVAETPAGCGTSGDGIFANGFE